MTKFPTRIVEQQKPCMQKPVERSIAFPAAAGFLAVVAGSLGAHALRPQLEQSGSSSTWQTAVLYHLVHAAVLLALTLYRHREDDLVVARRLSRASALIGIGIVLFSGSLYALSLGAPRWLGPVTPLGGLCLLAGWLSAGMAFRRRTS
jgi:uncharacterized membrane protein YgdD (TMEM256/DUF423 family)